MATVTAMGVVVIGGGYAGLASANRLAKLGHEVTLVESRDHLGGALTVVEQDGFRWDAGPSSTLLPAVARDLFRKSGRPLEKELDLVQVPVIQHRFDDDDETVLDLPNGSRGNQVTAIDAALGPGLGEQWAAYVDAFADDWEALRTDFFENPYDPARASAHTRALLATRMTMHKSVRRDLDDDRLRALALWPSTFEGHDVRNVPAWAGLWSYLEQNLGVWTVPGGMAQIGAALSARLETRGVRVVLGVTARDLVVEAGQVCGVRTDDGDLDADVVVCAIDPRRLPALAPAVRRTMPALPPVVCHLGIVGEVPDLPHEVVIHGEPTLVVRTGGSAPAGAHAWTVLGRGSVSEDLLSSIQRAGIRVRDQVEVRVDRTPRDLVVEWGGSPLGVLWQGRSTLSDRLGNTGPVEGLYLAGAHTVPGAGLPSVGLSAAIVATLIGPPKSQGPL